MSKNQPPSAPVSVDQSSLAWRMFDAFVSDSQISVTEEELFSYAFKELNISIDKLPPGLKDNLPVILVAFMNMWSGWHFKGEFLAGKFQKEHYFQRFQKFMVHKMNCTIRGQYASAVKALGDQARSATKGNDGKNDPDRPPYTISIRCPAHMLNTIVFSNSGDDVIMKQHLGNTWQDLSLIQLLNWPHIEVSFCTQDLHFIRRQATEFVRYLNFLPHESIKNEDHVIENVEILGQQECYSLDFLEKYIKIYLETLKMVPLISPSALGEIQAVLSQFWEDIRFFDVNKSMVTSTLVEFRLSPVPFIRNKKLVKTGEKEAEETRVGYCEIIIPKIQLLMLYFKPEQLETPHISFEYTEKIKKNPNEINDIAVPKITYKCTFCKVEYQNPNAKKNIMEHLKHEHKMEQHVRCTVCKKQFDVLNLTACRWRHKCVPRFRITSKTVSIKK